MGESSSTHAAVYPGLTANFAALMGAMLQDVARRLCGSLQVDTEKTRRLLGWQPPLTLDQGLNKAVGTASFTKD